jgi:two-component system sensor histidine kinase ChiS
MENEMDRQEDNFIFSEDVLENTKSEKWKILIVDDDADIHDVTKFVLKDFEFRNKKIHFISAFSIDEAKEQIKKNPDIALILLDIVMEEEDSGLKFVRYLRENLQNQIVRIVLRTGQPGVAPQAKVVIDYDINDYKEKTDLTKEKLFYTIVMALRSFEILKSFQLSLNFFESSFLSAERFIPKDYLSILDKKNVKDIKIGDFADREMTALFIDLIEIANANHESPSQKLQLINHYVNVLGEIIQKNNGFINYCIGHTIIALFDGPSNNAINTSIAIFKKISSEQEKRPIKIRIGIQTGLLTLGVIGNEDQMNYITLGDTINIATQVLDANKYYNTTIMIGEGAIKKIRQPENFSYRLVGGLMNENNKKKTLIYELLDLGDKKSNKLKQETKALFEEAVKDYLENRFKEAKNNFTKVLNIDPQDEIAKKYFENIK